MYIFKKRKSWIIQSKLVPPKVRVLKLVFQASFTQGKIISSSSLLLFFQLVISLFLPLFPSALQVQICLISISKAAASIRFILTFTSQYTIALFAHIPSCHDIKTDKRFLLINTFFFYIIIECSPNWSSPSLKAPVLSFALMMRLGNPFLVTIRNSNKFACGDLEFPSLQSCSALPF